MHFELSIINGKTVFDIVRAHRSECIQIVREAYLAHADGQSVNPDSYFLQFPDKPDCRIIALPAYLGKNFDVAGLKWIASYPTNIQRGFPRASAVLVLKDRKSTRLNSSHSQISYAVFCLKKKKKTEKKTVF